MHERAVLLALIIMAGHSSGFGLNPPGKHMTSSMPLTFKLLSVQAKLQAMCCCPGCTRCTASTTSGA